MNAEADVRNEWGLPPVEVTAHERANQTTHVDQSVNKALPWVAFSWFLSGGAIIGLILIALLMPEIIDSKLEKAAAQMRSAAVKEVADAKVEMAQQISDAKASGRVAEQHGRIALSEVERANAELAAKGLIKLASH